MRNIQLLIFSVLFFSCSKKVGDEKNVLGNSLKFDNTVIAFRRGDTVYSKTNNGKENLIGVGYFSCLSPDGKKLTYTKFGKGEGLNRQIYLMDLQTKQEVKLDVASNNFYNAIWSPNGKFIAFSIMGKNDWEVGLIKSDNTGFKTIKGKPEYGLHGPTWTIDSKSIVAYDLVDLIEFNIDGTIIRKFNISETIGDSCYVSSNSRFWLTRERDGFFFNSGVNEGMEGVDGPVEAISYYDLQVKKLKRISPTGLYPDNLFMMSDSKMVFSGSKAGQEYSDVYIYDFSKDKLDIFIEKGTEPSGTKLN